MWVPVCKGSAQGSPDAPTAGPVPISHRECTKFSLAGSNVWALPQLFLLSPSPVGAHAHQKPLDLIAVLNKPDVFVRSLLRP